MKKTFRYMAAATAVLAAFSCAKQEINAPEEGSTPPNTYEYVLNVTQEGDSKTTMDGNSILWSADDVIGVSCTYKDENGKSQYGSVAKSSGTATITDSENYTPSTSATFTLNLNEGFTPHSAGYPLRSTNMKITSGSGDNEIRMDIDIAAQQVGIPDNIPSGALGMVGKITDGECLMYNVGAVIKFEITNDDITSLKFEGNNSEVISGERYYYVKTGKFAYEKYKSDKVTVAGTTSVTLVPSGDVFVPGVYYFVVSPNTLEDGFTMTLTNSIGHKAVRKTSTKFEIKRNHKYTQFGSDKGWFKNVYTLNAGDLGSADGTTATLYGIVTPDEIEDDDVLGFETSADGTNWTKFEGTINERFSSITHATSPTPLNVFTADLTGIAPETTVYYRAYYERAENGSITYGKTKAFKTYANAESVKIDLYNGWSEGYWPFTNLTYGTDITSGKKEDATFKATDLTLATSTGSFVAKATNGFWLNTYNGCLTFRPVKGEYLKFPVIAGKKPVSVVMVIGNVNGNNQGNPAVHNMAESETALAGGGNQWDGTTAAQYDSHTWNLINTNDSQYGLYFNSSNNCYISYLEVVYAPYSSELPQTITQDLAFVTGWGNHNDQDDNPGNYSAEEIVVKAWPFTDAYSAWVEGEVNGPYHTAAYEDMTYCFKSSVKSKWGWSRAGIKFGGAKDDYMSIDAVANYRLSHIKIRGAATATKFIVTDASGTTINGGDEKQIGKAFDSIIEFTLPETTANTKYHLTLSSTTDAQIRELWITYELVK